MLTEKIKFTGLNMNINFGLSSDDNFLGFQQEIDNLTEVVSIDAINSEVDMEERKYKSINHSPTSLEFLFYTTSIIYAPNNYVPNLAAAGFSANDILLNQPSILNSFFILDYYDSFNPNTQTKIFTTYLTKINNSNYTAIYDISAGANACQFYYLYVPVWYIKAQTGSTVTGYTKFTFYNAKSGTTALFYNSINQNITTPEKMYFKTVLDLVNKTWRFIYIGNTVIAKQLVSSSLYNQKVNDSVGSTNAYTQNYPTGTTFNNQTGKYYTT